MIPIQMFRDEAGYPHAMAAPPYQPLAWFLGQDIQSDADSGREMIAIIGQVRDGTLPRWGGMGNSNELELEPGGARITNPWVDPPVPPCELSLDELEQALREWLEFLQR